tara:strand:+ start:189 stop:599 length:411 start_codon:yes stop_codon:yes gene_type:complete
MNRFDDNITLTINEVHEEDMADKVIDRWLSQLENDKKELELLTSKNEYFIKNSNTPYGILNKTHFEPKIHKRLVHNSFMSNIFLGNIQKTQYEKNLKKSVNINNGKPINRKHTSIVKPDVFSKNKGITKPFSMKMF